MNNLDLKNRISALISSLNEGLFERKNAIKLCMLAALCGESVFMLGPPGIAKSMIARRLSEAFEEINSFEYLMTRFSTPEEVFGPISIKALKEEGKYERLTGGYLPKAHVVFLDEIWKSGPAILNTLLTVINERIFKNGEVTEHIPLHLLITASNELPEQNSGLEALYDRMLIRIWLDPLKNKQNFKSMLTHQYSEHHIADRLKIKESELKIWQEEISKIAVTNEVFEDLYYLKGELEKLTEKAQNNDSTQSENVKQQMITLSTLYISDRRWKKAYHLMCASAYFNGRVQVEKIDLLLIKDIMWNTLHNRRHVYNIIKKYAITKLYKQEDCLIKLEDLAMNISQVITNIINDIGIKMSPKSHSLIKTKNDYVLNFTNNDLDAHAQRQRIVFLDECHFDPDNIDVITRTATVENKALRRWIRSTRAVPIHLNDNTIVEINFTVDSKNNLVARSHSGKIIGMTFVKRTGCPKWLKAKWQQQLTTLLTDFENINKLITFSQNRFQANADHLFISEDIMLEITQSINQLHEKKKLIAAQFDNLNAELSVIEEELS